MVFSIGRVCVKLAGRDAGKKCVVVDIIDERTVLIDGQTRRKNCNVLHLDPTKLVLDIDKAASSEVIAAAFEKEGLIVSASTNSKKPSDRPKKSKTVKNIAKSEKK